MTPSNIPTPEELKTAAEGKLSSLFVKLRGLLRQAEEKLRLLLKKAAAFLSKYWKFLILPARLLILLREKARQETFWNCEKN